MESWLIWKDPDGGRDWGQEEKGTPEDEMVGWHHWLNGHEFGWTLGVGDGQGGPACCSSRGREWSDTTDRLNWNHWNFDIIVLITCEFLVSFIYGCYIIYSWNARHLSHPSVFKVISLKVNFYLSLSKMSLHHFSGEFQNKNRKNTSSV